MALQTLEGTYKNGKIELDEIPADLTTEARVLVTFLTTRRSTQPEAGQLSARQAAGERLIQRMRSGIEFGGERFSREDLYAERLDSIAERDR